MRCHKQLADFDQFAAPAILLVTSIPTRYTPTSGSGLQDT